MASFERIRYLDVVLKEGMLAKINWTPSKHPQFSAETNQQQYEFVVTDIDRLVAKLFRICSVNPTYFTACVGKAGREVLLDDNPEAGAWERNT